MGSPLVHINRTAIVRNSDNPGSIPLLAYSLSLNVFYHEALPQGRCRRLPGSRCIQDLPVNILSTFGFLRFDEIGYLRSNVLPSIAAALSIVAAVSWKYLRPYLIFAWMCFFRPIGKKQEDQRQRLDSV